MNFKIRKSKYVSNYIKYRYGVQTVPTTWIGLEKWIQEVWREKEHMLNNIYKEGKKFPALNFRQHKPQVSLPLQYLSICAFCSFVYMSIKILFFFPMLSPLTLLLWAWIVYSTLAMVIISKYTPGIQEIEILLEKGEIGKAMWEFINPWVNPWAPRQNSTPATTTTRSSFATSDKQD